MSSSRFDEKWTIRLEGRDEMEIIVDALRIASSTTEGEEGERFHEVYLDWDEALIERSRIADLLAESFGQEGVSE